MSEGFVSVMVRMSFSTVYFSRTKNLFCNFVFDIKQNITEWQCGFIPDGAVRLAKAVLCHR